VTLRVQTANHDDLVSHQTVEDAIWKTPQEETPCVPVDDRCSHRMNSNHLQACPNCREKLVPEAGALVFVLPIRPFDMRGCCRSKDR
jgi:hypothetical protein